MSIKKSFFSTARAKLMHYNRRVVRTSDNEDVIIPGGLYRKVDFPVLNLDEFSSKLYDIVTLAYSDLLALGYVVVARNIEKKWYKMQKYAYFIVYSKSAGLEKICTRLPSGLKIEFNRTESAVRLVGKSAGKSGYGEWIHV